MQVGSEVPRTHIRPSICFFPLPVDLDVWKSELLLWYHICLCTTMLPPMVTMD
ncbi:rCG51622 [Rattus norvegicus]|uniref:RCG51622 n=1 Tax=Rattus norvegicus TaxID=10116 RepID=A6IZE2_RAT|nr:rCG51622 [Rattus norvegicus]